METVKVSKSQVVIPKNLRVEVAGFPSTCLNRRLLLASRKSDLAQFLTVVGYKIQQSDQFSCFERFCKLAKISDGSRLGIPDPSKCLSKLTIEEELVSLAT